MSNAGAISGADVGSAVSMAVAKQSLDAMEQQGAAAVSLIKAAGDVGATARGAVSPVPGAGETGRGLDVSA